MKKAVFALITILSITIIAYNGIGIEGYYTPYNGMYFIGISMESGDLIVLGLSIVTPVKYIEDMNIQALPFIMLRIKPLKDTNVGIKGGMAPVVWIENNQFEYSKTEFFWKIVMFYGGINVGVVSRYDFEEKENYNIAIYASLMFVF